MMYFYTEVEFNGSTKKLICFKDESENVWWLAAHENDPTYLLWVAEGNEAQPWE